MVPKSLLIHFQSPPAFFFELMLQLWMLSSVALHIHAVPSLAAFVPLMCGGELYYKLSFFVIRNFAFEDIHQCGDADIEIVCAISV